MLDDFAHEMDTTETKMDNVMKKMAKVMHMSNGRSKVMHMSNDRSKFTHMSKVIMTVSSCNL